MNQIKFYKVATFGLLLLNIGVLLFFFLTKPKHPPHNHANKEGFKSEVIDILNLDEHQQSRFEELAQEHNDQLQSIVKEQQSLSKPFFESLIDTTLILDLEKSLKAYQRLEQEKFEVTRNHLLDVKKLLHEDQLPHYEKFINGFIKIVLSNEEKAPPPPREFNK